MAEQNGSEPPRVYVDAQTAALGERVSNLNRRQTDLEAEMRLGFRSMESQITSFTNETRQALSSLTATVAGAGKPQWQALGVLITVIVVLVGLLYWPIRETDARHDRDISATATATADAIRRINETMVPRAELEFRSARGAEDRVRTDQAVRDLRDSTVTRNEWMERNASRDHDIENIRQSQVREVANIQRQIDQQRSDFQAFSSSLGNGRDFIQDLKREQDRLRDQLAEVRARQYRLGGTSPPPP